MKNTLSHAMILTVIILFMNGIFTIRAKDAAVKLPEAVLAVIKARYPQCTIRNVEMESERRIRFFVVNLTLPGRVIEVEITGAGEIIETEEKVKAETLPASFRTEISKLTADGRQIMKIEKHEIMSVPFLGAFRQLSKPILFYDLKTRDSNGAKQSVLFEEGANGIIKAGKTPNDNNADDNNDDDDDDDDDED